ncbi:tryptophan synthase beta subunit-like PLP-dependent enzyme [Aspergillus transmontanensis]|uniref:Tryptophan synthase beta subunit-like PLP-dependent enzyme n=1 Tax=Aspergillus transmontanensis TaxID=1034304 RepID=A0A5N6WFB4_9EURO|nr:tryptophan synthase beta subunit-like PLP-dependent enzyme [Aspergillus transmontanensis]
MRHPPPSVTRSLELIGNTPVVRLQHVVPSHCAQIFLKIESTNPTGSYKDRMAKSMIEEAERRGDLKPGTTIVEATGGSTGSSLAFVCAVKGYRFHVVSSNAFATEKLRTMAAFGANLDLIHSPSSKITPTLIPSMIRRAEEVSTSDGYYFTNQFKNRDALVGYGTIGHELVQQVPEIDAFCGAVGTAGMVMGVARVLKAERPETLISVLEPASSPTITQGRPGIHHVEGIGIGIIPPLLDRQLYDEALAISEDEGRSMCRRLAREEGLLVGTSTGLNVVAAIGLARKLGPGKTVVTVAADTGLKYLKGDLFTDE